MCNTNTEYKVERRNIMTTLLNHLFKYYYIKKRVSAKPFSWKWVLFAWEYKKNNFHINSFAVSLGLKQRLVATRNWPIQLMSLKCIFYFGGARSKGFATLRNVSKLQFFDKIGQAESVGFRLYSAIWRSESRLSSRYLEITSISLIYSLTDSRNKELSFWLSRRLNRLTSVTHQIRGDSKLRD